MAGVVGVGQAGAVLMVLSGLVSLKVLLLAGLLPGLAASERLAPAAVRPKGTDRPRLIRNLGFWLANSGFTPLFAPITLAAASLQLWRRPVWADDWAMLLVDLLILDLWIYGWHRANHEVPFLWRFHEVHHRDEFLDVTSSLRFHPGEVLLSALARGVLIVALAVPLASVAVYEALLLAAAAFQHSNLRLPAGWERALRLVFVTPSHHWVHHHALRADTDSNYATVLSVWDRLFGSCSRTTRRLDMPIGVEGARDATLLGLAVLPFQPQRMASRSVSTQSSS